LTGETGVTSMTLHALWFHVLEEELWNHLRIINSRDHSDCWWNKLVNCFVQSEHVASYI